MPARTITSYTGPAIVVLDNGESTDVDCEFVVAQDMVRAGNGLLPGLKDWQGTFVADGLLTSSGPGTLSLPNGLTARITVTRLDVVSGSGSFVGHGEPPLDA